MNEEAVNLIFDWAVGNGYKGTKEEWLNYIQTNDDAFNYVYSIAKRRGYQKDENAFGVLMGRTAPVAKTEPTATVAKTAPAKTEVVAEEPVKEISTKPLESVKAQGIPKREAEMPTADTTKMPPMVVREAEPEVKEEPKKEMPIGENLLPVTEKTEVKAVETPSDKMVIKSEKKGKGKVAPEPIKIEPIKLETKEGQIQVEVPNFAIDEPRKKYKPYGEKGPDVYYSEDQDQFIIKEGDSKTLVSKGSPKYTEIETKLAQAAGATKEGKGKCDTPPFIGCSPSKTALNEFLYYGLDDEGRGLRSTDEGGLIEKLDNRKQIMEKRGESLWSLYDKNESTKGEGDFYYANEAPPKSDRFIVYKPYGDDKTLIYDKESNIILKQLDGKAPFVDAQSKTRTVYNTNGDVFRKGSDPKEFWRNYAKENPNEGLTVWKAYEVDQPEYKELKSIIEGIDYKKAKGSKNTFIPTFNPVPETPEWQKQ